MAVQQPKVSIGTTVHIGDWSGTIVKINRDGVVLLLADGKLLPVGRRLIEDAVGGAK